jgi:aminodeoxyfutalosine deaminase
MSFLKFSADRIFDGTKFLGERKVLIFNQDGSLETITDRSEAGEDIRYFNGILTPGLVNCHCHIELSHMKGVIPPHTGLVDFLLAVVKNRGEVDDRIYDRIKAAENEMYENGIVAVADICNTTHAIATKKESKLTWYNLVEIINMFDHNLEKQWQYYTGIWEQHKMLDGPSFKSVLTPHAPYSVSSATHQAINNATGHTVISIHNQETNAENELFKNGSGGFLKLYQGLGLSQPPFAASGKSSLQTYLPYYTNGQTVLLVHNTFITEEDILFAKAHAKTHNLNIIYCLCPNANLYIENALPPVHLFVKHDCQVVLGTDSYSSNWQLNIASEVKTLTEHFPQLPLDTILKLATSNGAEVLDGSNNLGRFEKGKAPSLVLLETVPGDNYKLSGNSKRII